jgi:putative hydrolase of the HAD superfamily
MSIAIDLVAFDADDTLWVNEPYYREAEKQVVELLKHYTAESAIKDKLYQTQIRNLPHFGYGAKGFTLSLLESAIELSSEQISAGHIRDIIEIGKSLVRDRIDLLPHVDRILPQLAHRYPLMLLTKGDLLDQEQKLARSRLRSCFTTVEVVTEKDEQAYQRVLDRHSTPPERFLMIGNSLRSDILPVVSIGGHAIHIPYHTTWHHERVHPETFPTDGYWTLDSVTSLPDFLEQTFTIRPKNQSSTL